jgi:hypothetical protein
VLVRIKWLLWCLGVSCVTLEPLESDDFVLKTRIAPPYWVGEKTRLFEKDGKIYCSMVKNHVLFLEAGLAQALVQGPAMCKKGSSFQKEDIYIEGHTKEGRVVYRIHVLFR